MTHVFKSPKFHKELRMQYGPHKAISDSEENSKAASVRPGSRPQASSIKRQAQPEVVLDKKSIDRDPDIGYRGIAPELSRVCRVAGRSSARAVPRPERDSDRSSSSKKTNSPLKVSAMSAVPVAGSFRAVRLNSSVPAQLGFNMKSKIDKRSKRQAPSKPEPSSGSSDNR